MLSHSLTRSFAKRKWGDVRYILLGWGLNFVGWFCLLGTFVLYACELFSVDALGNNSAEQLLLSWIFSIGMRFMVNEPMLIVVSKGAPILFSSEFCANFCGEAIVNLLDLLVQAITSLIQMLTKP